MPLMTDWIRNLVRETVQKEMQVPVEADSGELMESMGAPLVTIYKISNGFVARVRNSADPYTMSGNKMVYCPTYEALANELIAHEARQKLGIKEKSEMVVDEDGFRITTGRIQANAITTEKLRLTPIQLDLFKEQK